MPKNILVIDDDPLVIRSVTRFLKSYGYDIATAQSGQEALEKVKVANFDLIISDIRMPGMDGIETLKLITESSSQNNKEKVPAVIITGYAGGDESYRKAGELGVVDYIYKPFELDEFITVVKRNLELPLKHERGYPRAEISFPVEVTIKSELVKDAKRIMGKTVDLSEDGVGLILDCLLPIATVVNIYANLALRYAPFQIEAVIVWAKPIIKDGHYRCGLHFLKIDGQHLLTLKEILANYKSLDEEFVSLTKEFEQYIQGVKNRFDEFEKMNSIPQKQVDFIELNKKDIFPKLDAYFEKIWQIVKDFKTDKYIVHQSYFQQKLHPLFEENIEINKHILRKPLGYPGDYIMMNFIYDYNGSHNYLGTSAYEKFINNYTCNIPISNSNIKRKDFLKRKILETIEGKETSKIVSVACGPARELIELLKEQRITKLALFKCLDFEKKALNYISTEIDKIEQEKKRFLSIDYLCRDITSIIRDKKLKEELRNSDLIYAFGIFDYLSERMASRLTKELFELLRKGGALVICNVSLENSSHRAYYELLGEWNMVYRAKEEMMSWLTGIAKIKEIKFEKPGNGNSYLFLTIKKDDTL